MRLLSLFVLTAVFVFIASITCVSASPHAFQPANAAPGLSGHADGIASEHPSIHAYRLSGGEIITLDGRLDDPAWQNAELATGFSQWDPNRGEDASEQTTFKIVYDHEAIYFGIACFESNSEDIRSQLCRRDNMIGSDVISIYVDTYHDHSSGYNFRVNPHGVQRDVYVYNDGHMDPDWDAVWRAETSVDESGWYAEMRIPFAAVRYSNGSEMTWGLNIYRYMHVRGEDTSWVNWDRELSGFVSRFGEITGLHDVPSARQLDLLPYIVHRTTDPSAVGDADVLDHFDNFGLDVKYGVTSDLTLNATFQPDFGQVEADPALLNLSPFETYYEEKRPFFVEGNRFFSHEGFRMFYSRRIGTGDERTRIRAAGKLTGKTAPGVSIAALYALTDITGEGQAHNFLKNGELPTHYMVGRVGKEFADGAHRFNLMQTAVLRPDDRDEFGEYATRDAFTSGMDFDLNFHDRDYNIGGSVVGSIVDPKASESDPDTGHAADYGTGGELKLRKRGGTIRGGISGRWETDRLDLNDVGFLSAPDEIGSNGWVEYDHESTREGALITRGSFGLNAWREWTYAAATGRDIDTGELAWSYGRGHPLSAGGDAHGWMQLGNYWNAWFGMGAGPESASKHLTRTYDGEQGPLMCSPDAFWGWWGFQTDGRKNFTLTHNGNINRNSAGGRTTWVGLGGHWTPTTSTNLSIETSYNTTHAMARHIGNFANPGAGIGSVSYVFAELDHRTIDATFRADVLFSRNLSLQFYAQPYLTVGEYSKPKQLARADSYDFDPAEGIPEFDPQAISDYDFRYASVNINVVLRWEYRPGSTFYLVWKQGRSEYAERGLSGSAFDTSLSPADMFDTEPENTFLAKVTYWMPI
jgi:hypothetical protein